MLCSDDKLAFYINLGFSRIMNVTQSLWCLDAEIKGIDDTTVCLNDLIQQSVKW